MKVRILSGNEAGVVREMEQLEAEVAINTGFGESAEPPKKPTAAEKKEAKAAADVTKKADAVVTAAAKKAAKAVATATKKAADAAAKAAKKTAPAKKRGKR